MYIIDPKILNLKTFSEEEINDFILSMPKQILSKVEEYLYNVTLNMLFRATNVIKENKQQKRQDINIQKKTLIQSLNKCVNNIDKGLITYSNIKFSNLFHKSGLVTGFNISDIFFQLFINQSKIPDNYFTFLRFCSQFISTTEFGVFSLMDDNIIDNKIRIRTIKNIFSDYDLNYQKLFFTPLLKGFIHGLVYCGFNRCYELLSVIRYRLPKVKLNPYNDSSKSIVKDNSVFTINLNESKLNKAQKELFWARESYRLKEFKESFLRVKNSLEYAVIEKLGLDSNDIISFYIYSDLINYQFNWTYEIFSQAKINRLYNIIQKSLLNHKYYDRKKFTENLINYSTLFIFSLDMINKKKYNEESLLYELKKQISKNVLREIDWLRKEIRIKEIMYEHLNTPNKKNPYYRLEAENAHNDLLKYSRKLQYYQNIQS